MDPRDYELLKRIAGGERMFRQKDGQNYDDFEGEVLRLIRLRDRGLITMKPNPVRSSQTKRSEYLQAGICELTADGRDALEGYRA